MMRAGTGSPSSLAQFQDAFAAALAGGEGAEMHAAGADLRVAKLVAQPAFAVYRNTVMKGCVDALQANYPAVARLVGDDWFGAAAVVFARAEPPRQPSLVDYGAGFAAFLADFAPARELPYLSSVARLDRFWTEAHVARDEAPVAAAALARLPLASLAGTVLRPHASARWVWFDGQPIATIWDRNRDGGEGGRDDGNANEEIPWQGEGMLIVRPEADVRWVPLKQADCAFLDACAAGGTLADAAAAALAVDPRADLSALMARMLDAGAFGQLILPADETREIP
jgi:hypothetical protein